MSCRYRFRVFKGSPFKISSAFIDHSYLMPWKIPFFTPLFSKLYWSGVKENLPSLKSFLPQLTYPNGHFRHSSTPQYCLQHSMYAFMLFISILTFTKQWRRRKMEKNERLSHFEKENWYLIPIIKINWHFPSPTHCSCVHIQFVFQSFRYSAFLNHRYLSVAAWKLLSLILYLQSFRSDSVKKSAICCSPSQEFNKFLINWMLS